MGYQPPDPQRADEYHEQAKFSRIDTTLQEILVLGSYDICWRRGWRLHSVGTDPSHVHMVASWRSFIPWRDVMEKLKNILSLLMGRITNNPRRRWFVVNGSLFRSSHNTISGNIFGANAHNAVSVISPLIGPSDLATGDAIQQNSFVAGSVQDIDLGDDGPTTNDPGDNDEGPNHLQNFPVLLTATSSPAGTQVSLRLDTKPGQYMVNFFSSVPTDNFALVPGKWALPGFSSVTIGTDPNAVYTVTTPQVPPGTTIWATATDAQHNTSEISAPITVTPLPPRVVSQEYFYFLGPQVIQVAFNEDVSNGLLPTALRLHGIHTGQDPSAIDVTWDPTTMTARFTLPRSLPSDSYVVTVLSSAVHNTYGQPLDGNGDGTAGGDYTFSVFNQAGDTNHDGKVDFADLLFLAQHYGQAYPAADLNGDGSITFEDLLILAQNYGNRVV